MLRLAGYLKRYRVQVVLGPIFKLTEAILELLIPMVMVRIIDVGIPNRDAGYVWAMGGLMLLIATVGLGCALICQYLASRTSQGVGTQLRNDLFAQINRLSHSQLDAFGTPSLITRITNDVNQVQTAVAMLIRLVPRAPFLILGAAVMTMLIDLKLSLIFLVTAPIIALILHWVIFRSLPYYKGMQKKLDRVSLITRENLTGVRVIRAFSRQAGEQQRFDQACDELARDSVRVGRIAVLLNPLTSLVVNLAIVALLWFGGQNINAGTLTQGEVIALINYMNQILLAMIVVANVVVLFTKASASAGRINELLEVKPELIAKNDIPITARPAPGCPKVELSGVDFSYTVSGQPALEQISLQAFAGQTIGIIGGTGSGKSTLVNLIARFYDPQNGQVRIDGVDIKDYPTAQLRRIIGVVPQRAVLFSGTLRENMRWADESVTDEQIAQALSIAQASEFVDRWPLGYDTPITQSGGNLSGGQRQRLTIARALAGRPQILILDDSASALDYATDARLRQALREHTAGMTVFLVSQRVASIRHADRIVVLDEGKIAAQGSHEQLLQSCALYREICQSQHYTVQEVAGA